MSSSGVLIAIEGVDGAGKTTLVHHLVDHYEVSRRVTHTRNVGDDARQPTSLGSVLYEFSLNTAYGLDQSERQLLLTAAVRHHHRVVIPMLRTEHDLVFCDRSSLSTIAYSSAISPSLGQLAEELMPPVSVEDLILWIDVPVTTALARAASDTFSGTMGGDDALMRESLSFHETVATYFRKYCERGNVVRLDGTQDPTEIRRAAIDTINAFLE